MQGVNKSLADQFGKTLLGRQDFAQLFGRLPLLCAERARYIGPGQNDSRRQAGDRHPRRPEEPDGFAQVTQIAHCDLAGVL